MNDYSRIVSAFLGSIWAIQPEKLEAIIAFVEAKAEGRAIPLELLAEIEKTSMEAAAKRAADVAASSGSVAVIPVFGTISKRANLMSSFSGGTSTEKLSGQLKTAIQDPSVKAIVLDVDSPGGSVDGVAELADEIYQARSKKPITAVSNGTMASAAYWLGSAASDIAVTPSGQVGSIGVFGIHKDISQALATEGIKPTIISAGKYKVEGNPYEPLSDEARGAMQGQVDEYYGMFTRGVARGRGVSVDAVRSGYGEGRMLTANAAVKAGMADKIATLGDVIASYGSSASKSRALAAMNERLRLASF